MGNKIEDYLHLYLGCEVQVKTKQDIDMTIGRMCEVTRNSNHGNWIQVMFNGLIASTNMVWETSQSNMHHYFFGYDHIKPLLRPLSDMEEEEKIMLCCLNMPNGWQPGHIIETNDEDIAAMRIFDHAGSYKSLYIPKNRISPQNFIWLLKQSFDLFGLIESGLAIDKTTL